MGREAPYQRVAADLRRRLTAGEWNPGDRLPARTQLAAEYQVGSNVLQKAQEVLIGEGLLAGRAGSGTYARQPPERLRLTRSHHPRGSDDRTPRCDLHGAGPDSSWRAHSDIRQPAPQDIARRLEIAPGDPCVLTVYEVLAEGRAVQLSHSWEPMAVTGGTPVVLPEDGPLAGRGIAERMRSIGVQVTTAVEIPRPGRASRDQATALGISLGALVQRIERTHYDAGRRPVETADIVIADTIAEIAYEIAATPPHP
ncbi:GntR family transcriptional regulator [Streptomyces sp. H39-S7]|uniref:GntR family transcriptional regulator n=1 Tax=Streptomyces sp. H39-S7 TaxID=3004357 RepID=UPI0022AEEFF7|nr:GntR family transcriptional regulator [Streptomyces sp. H39-S7]MCZ4124981.1 GntR family transcriptional regulator [Streptomyces sp. H39-S7]